MSDGAFSTKETTFNVTFPEEWNVGCIPLNYALFRNGEQVTGRVTARTGDKLYLAPAPPITKRDK